MAPPKGRPTPAAQCAHLPRSTNESQLEARLSNYYIYRYSSARVDGRSSTGVIRKPPQELLMYLWLCVGRLSPIGG
jgi:hypothetical protein